MYRDFIWIASAEPFGYVTLLDKGFVWIAAAFRYVTWLEVSSGLHLLSRSDT